MDDQRFKTEFKLFEEAFQGYKNKRIVIYGLGRYTISILPVIQDYNLVGLMDRDPDNIGKKIMGIPVISESEALEIADLIIINTAEAYWDTIYNRIKHLNIPVFYKNGQRAGAKTTDHNYRNMDYWNTSYESMRELAKQYDIVSFDVYDTLIMRRVYNPGDVFRLMNHRLNVSGQSYELIRNLAITQFQGKEYMLDELYLQMQKHADWTDIQREEIKKMELDIEYSIAVPRKKIVELFLELQKSGKEIYLISDMYLPKEFLTKILNKCGIDIIESNILISGEIGLNKRDGGLWRFYKKNIVKSKTALHIGDNKISDIQNARKEGITAYYIMGASEMLRNSSLHTIEPMIQGIYESVIMGLLCSELFNNPFQLNQTKGTIKIENFGMLGYCWFGSVVLTFLLWIIQQFERLGLDQMVFFARDGYFLLEDYQYLTNYNAVQNACPAIYLPISRRLILIAAIQDDSSLREAIVFPYNGSWEDYLFDRFDIIISPDDVHKHETVNASSDELKISAWLEPYKEELNKKVAEERYNYLKLLEDMKLSDKAGVIDDAFYGNNQHYLNRLLNKQLPGFYCTADLSIDNRCFQENEMYACFQRDEDKKAISCYLHKQILVLESFLTAPYGMIRKIDSNGNWICDSDKKSQEQFEDRIEINKGVKVFIKDYSDIMKGVELKINPSFIDRLYGAWLENKEGLSQEVKETFYWDNGMVQRREYRIFE